MVVFGALALGVYQLNFLCIPYFDGIHRAPS